jgi:pimeloyl-ACP methyl ester carboxylesterase
VQRLNAPLGDEDAGAADEVRLSHRLAGTTAGRCLCPILPPMSTFVLVHGAWHGAWCWDRLIAELVARGQSAVAMDLPCADGTATFSDYADAVVEAATSVSGEVVLVGHSLGSMTVPLVAARRPVSSMVLLCGVTPNLHGQPWDAAPQMEVPGTFEPLVTQPDGSTIWPDLAGATSALYAAARQEDAAWAFERLRPQNSTSLWENPYPLAEWPAVRTLAICCTDDVTVTPEFVRATCRGRLGVEPLEIAGDHSPFLSAPAHLADLLLDLTNATG